MLCKLWREGEDVSIKQNIYHVAKKNGTLGKFFMKKMLREKRTQTCAHLFH